MSADAEFILQHADSLCLLSLHGYQQIKAYCFSTEKVTDLLGHIIQREPEAARGLHELLQVAYIIDRSWRKISRLAVDIPSVKLEQIDKEHLFYVQQVLHG